MMIDPSIIEAKIGAARDRDNIVTAKLLGEIARLPVIAPFNDGMRNFDLNTITTTLRPGRLTDTGVGQNIAKMLPEHGSYAYQLYSAICFTIDARVELKLLELIASPDFYSALMRSAAEIAP
jgi:hypothetical protein